LECAGEASSPIPEPQQKKKMQKKKKLSTKATKPSKTSKTTKVQKDGREETSKIVEVSEEVTTKRISKKRLIMDL
jgi:hypothetical protein